MCFGLELYLVAECLILCIFLSINPQRYFNVLKSDSEISEGFFAVKKSTKSFRYSAPLTSAIVFSPSFRHSAKFSSVG